MRTLYRWGFALQSSFVVLASVAAYKSMLPRWLFPVPGLDKVGHFTMIGMLGFFLDGAIDRRELRVGPLRVPLAAVLVLSVAAVEEYLQRLSPVRDSSIWDYLADVCGVVALTWLSRRSERWVARALSRDASCALEPRSR